MDIKNIRIGEVLKEYGYITDDQIEQALAYQKQNRGKRLGGILIELGFITEKQMLEALAARLDLKLVEMGGIQVNVEAVERIPRQLAEKYHTLAVDCDEQELTVVANDPLNFYAFEDIRQMTGMPVVVWLSELRTLDKAIDYYYSEVDARTATRSANEEAEVLVEELEVEEGDGDAPIIKLLSSLVQRAYSTNTSDIHVEPFEDKTVVRMRIDGSIVDYVTLQRALHASLIARIKILGNMDIAERRVPQDGHFRMKLEGQNINIRVSVIPTVFGEKAVLRLLASNAAIDHEGTFGMNDESFEKFSKMLQSPNGIVYITGPTGSGKSTTLYMILAELSKRQVNISTIEDPVEKNLPRLNQMQVNNVAGLTFEVGLRALLRQDPDIIMVGETRDSETASISIRAAITGHLVFSTLHTNSAISSIVRLIDMGMERYMIANSLVGIVAQRLVRKVCPECSDLVQMTEEETEFLGKKIPLIRRGKGCAHCNFSGYSGRIAIHEIVIIDATIRSMISEGKTMDEITKYAVEKQGMKTLKQYGIELLEQGITTMEEVVKISYYA